MTTKELADQFISLCKAGKFDQVYRDLYSTDAKSIEPVGSPGGTVQGMDAILKKGKEWNAQVEAVHSSEISDAIVAEQYFACTMKMKLTMKGAPAPMDMEEICLYLVEDGKIVSEQFFYTPDPQFA